MIRRLFNKLTDWFFWAGDPNDVFGPTTLDEDF